MELTTIDVTPEDAAEAFAEYRQAVRAGSHEKYAAARREYEAIDRAVLRGYKEIAKGNRLIRLSEAIRQGGTVEHSWEQDGWRDGKRVRSTRTTLMPALAVCRADARHVHSTGVGFDGRVIYRAEGGRRKADVIELPGLFDPHDGFAHRSHRAIVPTIPPPFRPQHKLSGYHILWEADWELVAPVDPALLKHLGGDLYAVLAVWDLSALEQAVLGGMRAE